MPRNDEPCECCRDTGRIDVNPSVFGWKHLGGRRWQMFSGKVFEFTPEQRGVLRMPCPSCIALAA